MEADFQYHLFTAERDVPGEAGILTGFLKAGLDCLHIRKPGWEERRIADLVAKIPAQFRKNTVLHSYPGVAAYYGCGFQVNSRFPKPEDNPAFFSKSCHSMEESVEANSSGFAFTTLSPVFDSISKPGYNGKIQGDVPSAAGRVIALGGVTSFNADSLRLRGFSGAAFMGGVWENENGPQLFLKMLRMRNVGFQFITDGKGIKETVRQACNTLEGGCRWIQVRMKNADTGEIRETLRELLPICEYRQSVLIVDDHIHLAEECHGVHLGQNDGPVASAKEILDATGIIGLTANTKTQILDSMADLPDYYGIGPYRFTSTKSNLAPVLGLEGYKSLSGIIPKPYVAIGGIGIGDIPALVGSGAGIAVSSLIAKANDPIEITNLIRNKIYG